MNLLAVLTFVVYLVSGITFILALKFLSSPRTARTGNLLGAAGMALVVIWTVGTAPGMLEHWWIVLVAGALGSVVGVLGARRVPMTAMPQMVAIFNGRCALGVPRLGEGSPVRRAAAAGRAHGGHAAGRGHWRGEPDRLDRGLRQAAGLHSGTAGQLSRATNRGGPPARRPGGDGRAPRAGDEQCPAVPAVRGGGPRYRRGVGDAHRRRRHAGRHQPAQQLHRHRGGRHRLRAGELRAADRRNAGGSLGRHPHPAHDSRHEPLTLQRPVRRLRHGRGRDGRRRGG